MLSFDRNVADIDDDENSVLEEEFGELNNCSAGPFINDAISREVDYIFDVTLYYTETNDRETSSLSCLQNGDNKNSEIKRGLSQASIILRISSDLNIFYILPVNNAPNLWMWQSKSVTHFTTLRKDLLAFEIVLDETSVSPGQQTAGINSMPQGIYLLKSDSIDLIFRLFQQAWINAGRQSFHSYLKEIGCQDLCISANKCEGKNGILAGHPKTRCFSLSTDYYEKERRLINDKISLSPFKTQPEQSSNTLCQRRHLKYRSFDFEATKEQSQCHTETGLRFLPSVLNLKNLSDNVNLSQRISPEGLSVKSEMTEMGTINKIVECNCKRRMSTNYVELNEDALSKDKTKIIERYNCANENNHRDNTKKFDDEKRFNIQSSINGYIEGKGNWATLKNTFQNPSSLKSLIIPEICRRNDMVQVINCVQTNSLKKVKSGIQRSGDSRRKINFESENNNGEGIENGSLLMSPFKYKGSCIKNDKAEHCTNQVELRSRPISCSSFSSTQDILDSLKESTKDLEEKILSLSLLSQTYDEPKCVKSPMAKPEDTLHIECELNPDCDCFKYWKDLPLRPFLPYDYHVKTHVQQVDPQSYLAKLEKRHKELPNVSLWCNNESSHEETDSGIYICHKRVNNSAINNLNHYNDKDDALKQSNSDSKDQDQITRNQTLKPFRNRSQLVTPNNDPSLTQSRAGAIKPNLPFSNDLHKRSSMISFATCAPANKNNIRHKPIEHYNKINRRDIAQELRGNQESEPHISPLRRVIKKHFSIFNMIPKLWDVSGIKPDDNHTCLNDDNNLTERSDKPGVQIKNENQCRRNGSFYNSMPRKKNYILVKGDLNNPHCNQNVHANKKTNKGHAIKLSSDSEDLYVTMTGVNENVPQSQTKSNIDNLKVNFGINHNYNSKNQLFGMKNLEIRQLA